MASQSLTIEVSADTTRVEQVLLTIAKHSRACAEELAAMRVAQDLWADDGGAPPLPGE